MTPRGDRRRARCRRVLCRCWPRRSDGSDAAAARSAQPSRPFILQGAILIGLAIALRPVCLPAEVKAVTVALLGTAGAFGLAWLLATRTPLGRFL
jgi:hypothetical protein